MTRAESDVRECGTITLHTYESILGARIHPRVMVRLLVKCECLRQ